MGDAEALKAKGNSAFSAGNFEEAIEYFTEAIAADPGNYILYSNRSAARASLGQYLEALEDGEKVLELKPDWAKGYSRVGAAQLGLRNIDAAIKTYEKGLMQDPTNEALKIGAGGGARRQTVQRVHRVVRERLSAKGHAASRDARISQRPYIHENASGSWKRSIRVAQVPVRPSICKGHGGRPWREHPDQRPRRAARQAGSPKSSAARAFPRAYGGRRGANRRGERWEGQKEAAQKEKELGNAAYKARSFDEAIQHYNRAMELDDSDVSFLLNRAAVYFEINDLDKCIEDCDAAVDKARALRADYKVIGKALTRKGNALVKKDDYEGAIAIYQKALTEHRNADTLKRLNETEKKLKEKREREYINLDISNEEREKGNQAFKEQKFPEAVKHYTEAIARGPPSVNPEAYKLYSNRAACYTKLGTWDAGLKDADECIRLEPTFVKGYTRKGLLQFFMKEYEKALQTYEQGLKHDPENDELREGVVRCMEAISKLNRGEASEEELKQRQAKAMADPEIQNILTDPIMRQVLQDFQEDPVGAQKHLKQPHIMQNIQKLVSAGIVRLA
eukprot:jgi/Botrbrau1/13119/Bobra.0187s0076.1